MLVIRLKRVGKKHQPEFRIVVAQKEAPVKGKYVDAVGYYHPKTKELKLDKDKVGLWLKKGAQPSNTVAKLLAKEKIELPKWVEIAIRPKRPKKAELRKKEAGAGAKPPEAKESGEQKPVEGVEKPEENKAEQPTKNEPEKIAGTPAPEANSGAEASAEPATEEQPKKAAEQNAEKGE